MLSLELPDLDNVNLKNLDKQNLAKSYDKHHGNDQMRKRKTNKEHDNDNCQVPDKKNLILRKIDS